MTGTSAELDELLARCDALGVRLTLAGDGGLTIDAPRNALTPDLVNQLKAHKADLLVLLQRPPVYVQVAIRHEAEEAGVSVWIDHLSRCTDSRWAIRAARLCTM